MARRKNRLAEETSPYLLQHARNPVDWYPWGEEALTRAQREDKPILLSIGYAACHWCHVMERESFENETIARLMNEHFVCIKVDREERPDLDELYMSATVALSGSGGWPMTVFLTPEREPFFAGTYFPPEDRAGRPGFPSLLERVHELWSKDRPQLITQARDLTEQVRKSTILPAPSGISVESIRVATQQLSREFDRAFGGFGGAPKFPPSAALSLLLRHHRRTRDPQVLTMVERTLDGMSQGGLYDQLGGGFARYSIDERWLVPHFEKMLYDNAQLAEVYLEAYQVTGSPHGRRVARETLDYVLREMQSPSGGFFSSSDADSEGEEGKFFVFTRAEIKKALGEPDATRFSAFYGVTEEGNFEGKNVLTLWRPLAQVARELGVNETELLGSIERGRERLFELRSRRVPPAVDDKVLTAWNGLMIRALAQGARVLGDPIYAQAATRAARFILDEMSRADGGLYRTARAGRAHLQAYLEDYAFFADGLLSLYECGGDFEFLREAERLAERILQDFSDPEGGALFHTANDHEELIARAREGHDGALPSPNAVACRLLARLAVHLDRPDFKERAIAIARAFAAPLKQRPRAHCALLSAIDFLLEPPIELVLTGDPEDERFQELAAVLGSTFLPHRIEARVTALDTQRSTLTRGKGLPDGRPAVFICEDFVCRAPLTDPEELSQSLSALDAERRSSPRKELGRPRLPGRASPEGTARRARASGLPDAAFTIERGLTLGRLAWGSYRVGLDHPEHRQVLTRALSLGWNVIDTSPSFALGDSERLIGEVLNELAQQRENVREEVFLISKLGVAHGAAAERLEQRKGQGEELLDTVPLQADRPLDHGAFSLDPVFLAEQLQDSLERLGVEHLDVCLLQSPEHLWSAGYDAAAFEHALRAAFRFLEAEVQAGRVGNYGVMTSRSQIADGAQGVDVERLVAIARELAGEGHHFRYVETPINLVERDALEPNAEGLTWLDRARRLGLSVIGCRPLSAIDEHALIRLIDPPASPDGASTAGLSSARYRVASLEVEFETTLAPALRLAGLLGKEPLLPLSRVLGPTLERAVSLEQFEQAETTLVTPQLRGLLSQLDRAHRGSSEGNWLKFRADYVKAVGVYLACVRELLAERNRAFLSDLKGDLRDHPTLAGPLSSFEDSSWFERAVGGLLLTPHLPWIALGLRRNHHLDQARALLEKLPL